MANDNSTKETASYEVVGRRHGRIKLEIMIPGEKMPVQHGVPVEKANKHRDGVQAYIEESVQRIAARHTDPGDVGEKIPDNGQVDFDPRTKDGKPPVTEPKSQDGGEGQ